MKRLLRLSIFVVTLGLGMPALRAENWPNWRGPNLNGSTSEKGLPTSFSKTENVLWVAQLPGPGASTPAVWEDSVFLTSVDDSLGGVVAIKLDRKTGKEVWRKKFAEGTFVDDRSNFASPSPVTDGKAVYFFAGSGDLVCFDMDGKEIWSRNIQSDYGEFAFNWTFSSSPLLFGGKLYLQILQRNKPARDRGKEGAESFLLAMDPATGKELWRHVRPSDAVEESLEAFSTPIPFTHEGREMIAIAGGDCLTAHDPADGKEIWRWGTWNPKRVEHWRLVPSPVYGQGVVLVCAPKGEPIFAVKAGGKGKLSDTALAWKNDSKGITSDVPTPLFYKGRFYVLDGNGKFINCLNPETGQPIWSERLDAKTKFEASPTGADGRVYLMNHLGEVFVLAAGDKFEILYRTVMGEDQSTNLRTPIVPAQNHLFIRTDDKLYCIGS